MRVLLIDNEDSFTWNLWQLVCSLGAECDVHSKNAITIGQIKKMKPDRIVISPGPGSPREAVLSCEVLRVLSPTMPTLGVCLGHQCIAAVYGGTDAVGRAQPVCHGKTSQIFHTGTGIFSTLPSPFRAARYHSLIVKKLPENFELLCWTGTQRKPDLIMGMRHRTLPMIGIQFHPESFLTQYGERLVQNFLCGRW